MEEDENTRINGFTKVERSTLLFLIVSLIIGLTAAFELNLYIVFSILISISITAGLFFLRNWIRKMPKTMSKLSNFIKIIPGWIFLLFIAFQSLWLVWHEEPRPEPTALEEYALIHFGTNIDNAPQKSEWVKVVGIVAQLGLFFIWRPPLTTREVLSRKLKAAQDLKALKELS